MTSQDLVLRPNDAIRALEEVGLDLQVGDILVASDGRYLRVEEIDAVEEGIRIILFSQMGNGEWSRWSTSSPEDVAKKGYIRIGRTMAEVAAFEEEAIASLSDTAALDPWAGDEVSTATDIVATSSKQSATLVRDAMQAQMQKVEAMRRVIERRTSRLRAIVSKMHSQIAYMNKVLGIFELYLGVREEITQIRDGEAASADAPIHLFQQVLYMDEECGDPRKNPKTGQPGIDFSSVEDFDAWVAVPEHCDLLLPMPKGIRAIKPSRQKRSYADNDWINALMNAKNKMVYLLCRNGDRVYRIWTSISMESRLFPGEDEADQIARRQDEGRELVYKKHGALLQGIIDRTPIFLPMTHPVNLFDPETFDGLIEMVFDDEPSLHTGRERYPEWKSRINDQIRRGTRILVALHRPWHQIGSSDFARVSRFHSPSYLHALNTPPFPPPGVYTVEDVLPQRQGFFGTGRGERLIIRYNPRDTVGTTGWEWDPHERKRRVSFVVYRSDSFVLNYDLLTLADVEYFIHSRIERKKYLDMIPVLWGMREARLEEMEWEKGFVKLVSGRLECDEVSVWEAIEWWKRKVLWTRPLTEDDAKALRMIESRIRRNLTRADPGAPGTPGE